MKKGIAIFPFFFGSISNLVGNSELLKVESWTLKVNALIHKTLFHFPNLSRSGNPQHNDLITLFKYCCK
jgi:hypothetical protein